ncbi:DXD sugar-binding motif protein [uncultured virus]|nr:DXD sugar-binding motif protein [uncultured virus]
MAHGAFHSDSDEPEIRESDERIPKVIHQTWKTTNLPEEFATYTAEWKRLHPLWRHCLWTDEDNRRLVERRYAWFLPIYDGYEHNICRVDAARYFILHRYGGVYADLDAKPLRPFDALVDQPQTRAFFGAEPLVHARLHGRKTVVCNAVMGSVRGHPLWPRLFERLVASRHKRRPLHCTGPIVLTQLYEQEPSLFDDVVIYEPETFYPLPSTSWLSRVLLRTKSAESYDTSRSYAAHLWRSTWAGDTVRKNTRAMLPYILLTLGLLALFAVALVVLRQRRRRRQNDRLRLEATTAIAL